MRLPNNLVEDALDIIGTYRYHFMISAIYVAIMGGTAFYAFSYALPVYGEKQPIVDEANKLNSEIKTMKASGLTVKEFMALGKEVGSELSPETIQDQGKLQKAITKPKSFRGDYLAWLADEMKLSEKRGIEIDRNDRILKSILPSFVSANKLTAGSLAASGESLTLENFVEYVETNILRKFNVESSAAIGIDGMEFSENQAGTLNIGSFRIKVDFQGDVRDIRRMIDFIQASGQFSIKDGHIEGPLAAENGPTKLSENLLVDITDFSVNGWLLPDDPVFGEGAITSGTVSLEFYVQGNSSQKVLLMRKQVMDEYGKLGKKIKSYETYCEKSAGSPCANEAVRLAAVAIRNQYTTLESYSDRIKSIERRKEVSKIDEETEELLMYQKAFEQIGGLVDRNIRMIESVTNPSAKSAAATASGSTAKPAVEKTTATGTTAKPATQRTVSGSGAKTE